MTLPRRTEGEAIIPFSCGSQYLDWQVSNCGRCKKAASLEDVKADKFTCEIERAIGVACISDGTVSAEIAQRMGYIDNNPPKTKEFSYLWQCGEVEWTEGWKKKYRERHEGKKSKKD